MKVPVHFQKVWVRDKFFRHCSRGPKKPNFRFFKEGSKRFFQIWRVTFVTFSSLSFCFCNVLCRVFSQWKILLGKKLAFFGNLSKLPHSKSLNKVTSVFNELHFCLINLKGADCKCCTLSNMIRRQLITFSD